MTPDTIELGMEVQDKYTKFKGTVVAITHYLHEPCNIAVQSNALKNGLPLNAQWFPISRVELIPAPKPKSENKES